MKPLPSNPLSFDPILRFRLRLRCEAAGGITTVAREMGQSHAWLTRKLSDDYAEDENKRTLFTRDVDRVLRHLRLPPSAVLDPVLFDGDEQLLVRIDQPGLVTRPLLVAEQGEGVEKALARLLGQGLVVEDERHEITLTCDGFALIAT